MQEARFIWDRLDDLHSSDPKAYKSFIEKQMEQKEVMTSQPRADFCVLTSSKIDDVTHDVFINVCSWKRMPDVKNENDPIQLMNGKKLKKKLKKGNFGLFFHVAVNDRILKEIKKNENDKKDFIQLILKFSSQLNKLTFDQKYSVSKEIFCGVFPSNPRSLFLDKPDLIDKLTSETNIQHFMSSPDSLLEQLSMKDDVTSRGDDVAGKNFFEKICRKH